jgi:hypothetical protein
MLHDEGEKKKKSRKIRFKFFSTLNVAACEGKLVGDSCLMHFPVQVQQHHQPNENFPQKKKDTRKEKEFYFVISCNTVIFPTVISPSLFFKR